MRIKNSAPELYLDSNKIQDELFQEEGIEIYTEASLLNTITSLPASTKTALKNIWADAKKAGDVKQLTKGLEKTLDSVNLSDKDKEQLKKYALSKLQSAKGEKGKGAVEKKETDEGDKGAQGVESGEEDIEDDSDSKPLTPQEWQAQYKETYTTHKSAILRASKPLIETETPKVAVDKIRGAITTLVLAAKEYGSKDDVEDLTKRLKYLLMEVATQT